MEFFCTKICLLSVYLDQYGCMGICILDSTSIHCYLYICMYLFKMFPVLVIEYASRWCHFGVSYLCFCCLLVLTLLYFLAPQNAPCSFCIFLTYIIQPAISLRRSNASYWATALEINLWMLGMLTASEAWLFLGSLSWQSKKIYVYFLIVMCKYIDLYIYWFLYIYTYIYIDLYI